MASSPPQSETGIPDGQTFLKAHWECLTATDFLSVEVYTTGPSPIVGYSLASIIPYHL
jgi:hypothetical protein